MKRYTIHSLLTACLMTMVTGLALVSCSQDDSPETPALVPEGSPVTVTLSISTRAEGSNVNDPYYGYPDGEVKADLINDWYIIITKTDGNGNPNPDDVVKTIRRSKTGAVTEEAVSVELSAPAEYCFFAFANWGSDLTPGSTDWEEALASKPQWDPIDISTRLSALNSPNRPNDPDYTDTPYYFVPMSGMKCVTVTRHVNQKYAIEVIRMLAKIRFEFVNDTEHSDITVDSVRMSPYSDKGTLNLFPQYNSWDFLVDKVSLTDDAIREAEKKSNAWEIGKTLKKDPETESNSWNGVFTRYIREAEATEIYKSASKVTVPKLFRLNFEITRGGKTSDTPFTYLAEGFTYVNRNDYVILPIRFTDWVIEFDIRSYPPIGGYPAKKEADNDAYFLGVFQTPGRFELVPRIYHYNADGEKTGPLPLSDITFEAKAKSIDPNDEKFNILESDVKTAANEIIGDIRTGATGYDEITFTLKKAKIGDQQYTEDNTKLPSKRIFIIRE